MSACWRDKSTYPQHVGLCSKPFGAHLHHRVRAERDTHFVLTYSRQPERYIALQFQRRDKNRLMTWIYTTEKKKTSMKTSSHHKKREVTQRKREPNNYRKSESLISIWTSAQLFRKQASHWIFDWLVGKALWVKVKPQTSRWIYLSCSKLHWTTGK